MTVQPSNPIIRPSEQEVLTISEMRKRYPQEWLLIADTESDDDFNIIKGELLAHSSNREEIDQALLNYSDVKSLAIEYTGPISEDYAVIL
ncbi:hypothetical protein C7H19_11175 [Aphanothece hegewaldii CCALA 016]|uniref:DUF5678 domain-containing protein n=1 Tax=Aphanothece hegewaldii CCALA 016 TaxID=2107694 RepID=A0A2T1LY42_9CHRO|nr:hypothetical protein [Aphanothece hegewaldii]PSF37271.1 hypothetical protein C7H19_11175 [Aphanothece hegewaldii CCALA 016]